MVVHNPSIRPSFLWGGGIGGGYPWIPMIVYLLPTSLEENASKSLIFSQSDYNISSAPSKLQLLLRSILTLHGAT